METRNQCEAKPLDDMSPAKGLKLISENMKIGTSLYLAFLERSFYILIFVFLIITTANIALIDTLPARIENLDSSKISSHLNHIYTKM